MRYDWGVLGSPDGLAPPSDTVRRRMQTQRRIDTKAETQLRRELFLRGRRYRVAFPVPGLPRRTIDVAFPRRKVAVFVDGCFWHGCPEHHVPPKNNAAWWEGKIRGNVARDQNTAETLREKGWTVVRLWEHLAVDDMVRLVEAALSHSEAGAQ